MKKSKFYSFLICSFLLCFQWASQAQIGCGLNGPGANDQTVTCGGPPSVYTSTCVCQSSPWNWSIGGQVDIFPSTSLPQAFSVNSLGTVVTGTVINANHSNLRIQWDCPPDCEPGEIRMTTIEHCGTEFFDPTIQIACEDETIIPCEEVVPNINVTTDFTNCQRTFSMTKADCFDSFTWDITDADGNPVTITPTPTANSSAIYVVFPTSGTYTVCVTYGPSNNSPNTVCVESTVNCQSPPPCESVPIDLTVSNVDCSFEACIDDSCLEAYQWNVTDVWGNSLFLPAEPGNCISYNFNNSGDYEVCVTYTTADNVTGQTCETVHIKCHSCELVPGVNLPIITSVDEDICFVSACVNTSCLEDWQWEVSNSNGEAVLVTLDGDNCIGFYPNEPGNYEICIDYLTDDNWFGQSCTSVSVDCQSCDLGPGNELEIDVVIDYDDCFFTACFDPSCLQSWQWDVKDASGTSIEPPVNADNCATFSPESFGEYTVCVSYTTNDNQDGQSCTTIDLQCTTACNLEPIFEKKYEFPLALEINKIKFELPDCANISSFECVQCEFTNPKLSHSFNNNILFLFEGETCVNYQFNYQLMDDQGNFSQLYSFNVLLGSGCFTGPNPGDENVLNTKEELAFGGAMLITTDEETISASAACLQPEFDIQLDTDNCTATVTLLNPECFDQYNWQFFTADGLGIAIPFSPNQAQVTVSLGTSGLYRVCLRYYGDNGRPQRYCENFEIFCGPCNLTQIFEDEFIFNEGEEICIPFTLPYGANFSQFTCFNCGGYPNLTYDLTLNLPDGKLAAYDGIPCDEYIFLYQLEQPDCISEVFVFTITIEPDGGGCFNEDDTQLLTAPQNNLSTADTPVESFSLYPNPASDWVQLNLPIAAEGTSYSIKVYNNQGALVLQEAAFSTDLSGKQLDISQLNKGLYYVQLWNQQGVVETQKLIIH